MKGAILGAVMLACIGTPAAAREYPCWLIKLYVKTHSRASVEKMAKKYQVTSQERKAALACLRVKDEN